MVVIEVDVLIVGGGASGLTASLLLSSYGIGTLLVSKYPETSTLPKAHLLSMKTMEMYRELGIEPAIRAAGTPAENMRYVGWYAGLAGPTPDHGREIARLGAWGRGHDDADWRSASAIRYANLMQARLEPLLKAQAEAKAPGAIRFNHGFESLVEDETGVVATIVDRASGERYQVRARYLLACDGGRAIGPQLGVTMDGHLGIATSVSIHFSADLSAVARDPEVLIRTILNPDTGSPCVLVPVGPDNWGPHSQEWVLHFIAFPGDHKTYDHDQSLAAMRLALGLPDFDPVIHVINRWPLDAVVASHYRVGRTFILGDAAHRMPPSGGHGLNSAVQDCYNLCWKIAAVLRGEAGDALLDTYEAERRPVAQRTVASAFANWTNAREFAASISYSPAATPEQRWQALRTLWDDTGATGDAARRNARNGLTQLLTTYNHIGINFGYDYATGALVADGTAADTVDDPILSYAASTRPGASLPTATLEDLHGSFPIGDLLGGGRFVLIAGEQGQRWCDAARDVAQRRGIPLDAVTIGRGDVDHFDLRREWDRRRGIAGDGAILVRPDRFVAWRAMTAAADPVATLEAAFDTILASGHEPAAAMPAAPAVVRA